ncbi:MAG: hypothetical protein N2589_07265 [bacterium]|nr:hypothetical protein [bacterium]MCX7917900.1 hypothetical protein [bacterium]MDW8163916.1 hypothetical protein [Candidatus Omnitrophota bacterium]
MGNKKRKNRNSFNKWLYFLISGFFLIIYVFLYLKIIYLGYLIDKCKEEYELLSLINKKYTLQFITLTTPENLKKLASEKNINLVVPENVCFLEIKEEDEKNIEKSGILEARTKENF